MRCGTMRGMAIKISGGTAHPLPSDMRQKLGADKKLLGAWESLTPLARNEWVCWVVSCKKEETHLAHLKRFSVEVNQGKRRPCCFIGCIHRTDKKPSASIRGIIASRSKSKR